MDNLRVEIPISAESKAKLQEETYKSIQSISTLVVKVRNSIAMIDNVDSLLTEQNLGLVINKKEKEMHHLRRLSEYTLLIGLIYLDINTAFRISLNAIEPYEIIYSTKQVLITINEGYKKIYNYLGYDNGIPKPNKRNQSYWIKDIGKLINTELPELIPEYNEITKKLDEYDDQELKDMKKSRDLSIHYDDNASKVYDMLISIDIETLIVKALPFIQILNNMFQFNNTILNKYTKLTELRENDNIEFHLNQIEYLKSKHPEATDLLNEVQEWVKNFGIK